MYASSTSVRASIAKPIEVELIGKREHCSLECLDRIERGRLYFVGTVAVIINAPHFCKRKEMAKLWGNMMRINVQPSAFRSAIATQGGSRASPSR